MDPGLLNADKWYRSLENLQGPGDNIFLLIESYVARKYTMRKIFRNFILKSGSTYKHQRALQV